MIELNTLGALKSSGYKSKSIQDEIKDNLKYRILNDLPIFEGIHGYEHSVLPDVERALLSGHNILFLGLRGQAKTRIARQFVSLLDEFIPIVRGSEINDDPFHPISKYAVSILNELGDNTPIEWVSRNVRYVEKLATPDVSVADLLGDLDPIKAATRKLEFSDEHAIHFGLIPRSNRSVFVINELPDLQTRIQVALLNILEEKDVQIRGFKIKLPLNILFVFTANPEDYTQRGNIITPLKDRIQSQILTHYPDSIAVGMKITEQEAQIRPELKQTIAVSPLLHQIIEQIAFVARNSELVDQKSGVSARLTISALELLYSAVEQRMLHGGEKNGVARLSDLIAIVPAMTGKMELVYEGEQLGPYESALTIINQAIQKTAASILPKVDSKKKNSSGLYQVTADWFSQGNRISIDTRISDKAYMSSLLKCPMHEDLIKSFPKKDGLVYRELVLHTMAASNIIQKDWLDRRIQFKDPLSSMLNDLNIQ
ncbi:MAG: AAA family ATPase [Saprospiraceae bacterium]|nr:AAA family ATPase [Saprospiraceae bacterium]HMW37933.1 AAA family ATPase [Saprospiraceae bacterium]HMX87607.1 AAA family ATPase [Saprospiraceae bacterium]HMZ39422.1 AAA family ATPase [Saprospiraceae bacterium]HNA63682.1 AAA family ATPase [Saprospiraceae bacterium]